MCGVGLRPRWYVVLVAGILSLALTLGIQAVSAQRGGGSPPPPAELDYLCVNGYTGVIRDVSSPACQPHESLLTLPDDYPFLACANNYGETLLCVIPSTGILKSISSPSFCPTRGTVAEVIPAPEVGDDSYTALANVPIDVPVTSGVLVNDTANTGVLSTYDSTSANGGTVAVEPDGSFHYTPPPGFTGTDTFTYIISNSSGNTTGTATVEVSGPVIWFVNSALEVNGDGTLAAPFNTLASLNTDGADPDAPGEIIYLFESATSYEGGIVLETDQALVGQDVDLATGLGITVPPFTTLPPVNPSAEISTITNASGDGVTLEPGTLVAGLAVSNTSDSGVSGAGFTGDATLDRVTISQPGNGDPAVDLSEIDGTITLTGSQVTGRNGTSPGGTGIDATTVVSLEIIDGTAVRGGNGQSSTFETGATGGGGIDGWNVGVAIDTATVRGGNGGVTAVGNGGHGGSAMHLSLAELTVTNGATVTGGSGARGWEIGGAGGAAISGNSVTFAIDGSNIVGGVGGVGDPGAGGDGGRATVIANGKLTITGSTVTGGSGNESSAMRGGDGAPAIWVQNVAVTVQAGSTVTGGSGGSSNFDASNGYGAPGVDTDNADLTITASTVTAGGGSPAESAVTITNERGEESFTATLTNNTLQTPSAAVPSLLVRASFSTARICLNASGNSNGSGGAPAGPFVLDNNGSFLGIAQTTLPALSADNNGVVVQSQGALMFSCTQG